MDSFAGDDMSYKSPLEIRGIRRCIKWKNIDKSGEKCYNIGV